MTVTVRRLLALAEWSRAVEVLAGAAGVDREVRHVRTVLDLNRRNTVRAGELIIVASPVAATDWRVDQLLRLVSDAGGAGVLISGAPLAAPRLLADRIELPLLGVKPQVTASDPLDLFVAARLHLAAPDLDRAELTLATHAALYDRPRAPEEITATLHDLLRAPVALLDGNGEPLAGHPVTAGTVRLGEPVPQRSPLPDGELLAHPVLIPPAIRPALWLVAEIRDDHAAWADTVPPALALAAVAAQRWLLVHRLESERDVRYRATLLGDVLRLVGEPTADLRRRATDAGWRLGGWHIGVRIGTGADTDIVSREPDVLRVLQAAEIEVVLVGHGSGWTGWATFDAHPSADRVRSVATRLRNAHRELRRTMGTHMGVGRPHPQPDGLAVTVAEATDAARLAVARPETGHFLHIDQLGMAQLLLEWTRTETFEPAARALLAPLRGRTGELVRTLATYLDAESSLAETAALLDVHRNTVAARITKIERLLDIDLGRADNRLALQLACRAVDL